MIDTKRFVLCVIFFLSIKVASADINILLLNDIYESREEAQSNIMLLKEELSEIFSYDLAPAFRLSEQFNVVGVAEVNNGERGFFNVIAEYLANRENAERLKEVLTNPEVVAQLRESYGDDAIISSSEIDELHRAVTNKIGTDRLIHVLSKLGYAVKRLSFVGNVTDAISITDAIFADVASRQEAATGDTARRKNEVSELLRRDENTDECVIAIVTGNGVVMANDIYISNRGMLKFNNQLQLIGAGTRQNFVLGENYVYDTNDGLGERPIDNTRVTSSTNFFTTLPDGAVVPSPGFVNNILKNYFDGNQSGPRLRGLIIDAAERVKDICNNFKIKRIVADDDDFVLNTDTGFLSNDGQDYDIEIFFDGTPRFPVTAYFNTAENSCDFDNPSFLSCRAILSLRDPANPYIIEENCMGAAFLDPIVIDGYYFLRDANGVATPGYFHSHECDFVF